MNLVIVESPAKAKTINKYLGDDYMVLASYGHIRDLPSKNGAVDPDDSFKMKWEVDSFSKKYLKEITDAVKEVKEVLSQDSEQIKTKLDALKAIVNEITTELYKNATPPPGAAQQEDGAKSEEKSEPEPEPESKPDEEKSK